MFTTTSWNSYYYSYFTGEETEAQRRLRNVPGRLVELGFWITGTKPVVLPSTIVFGLDIIRRGTEWVSSDNWLGNNWNQWSVTQILTGVMYLFPSCLGVWVGVELKRQSMICSSSSSQWHSLVFWIMSVISFCRALSKSLLKTKVQFRIQTNCWHSSTNC